jgi:hypothetical protein
MSVKPIQLGCDRWRDFTPFSVQRQRDKAHRLVKGAEGPEWMFHESTLAVFSVRR